MTRNRWLLAALVVAALLAAGIAAVLVFDRDAPIG
jgi:hypothetical protein